MLAKKLAGIPQGWISATSPQARGSIPSTFSQLRLLNTPVPLNVATPEGRMKLYIENIASQGDLPVYIKDDLDEIARRNVLLAANPTELERIRSAGPNMSGIGNVSFEWADGQNFQRMEAPRANMTVAENRAVMKSVEDAYYQQLIPQLIRENPGQQILLNNNPVSLRRATLYERRGGMSPVDPLGAQYSLIQPTGQVQPMNIFGGGLPRGLTDTEALQRIQKANLLRSANVPNQKSQIDSLIRRAYSLGWGPEAAKRTHRDELTGGLIKGVEYQRRVRPTLQQAGGGGEVWY